MAHDLSPEAVAARLEALRRLWVPQDAASVRARMQPPRAAEPSEREPFERGVARRLRELRALMELTAYLHRRSPSGEG